MDPSNNVQSYGSDTANISFVDFKPLEAQPNGPYIPAGPINSTMDPLATLGVPTVPSGFSTTPTTPEDHMNVSSNSHVLAYVLVPLGTLAVIILISFMIFIILRKSRMDRLRHHLMPLYNFDPMEEEGDWESELLEEEKEQQMVLHSRTPKDQRGPKLKFHTDV